MDGNALGDAILAAVDVAVAAVGDPTNSAAVRQAVFRAIGNTVVDHITANAAVSVNTTVNAFIPVAVTPATGLGSTTATGTGFTTTGTIS